MIHQRDIESTNKLFPYEYPNTLSHLMSKKDYIFLISSVNSIIFSETQCYDFMQVLKRYITHIIGLILLVLIMSFHLVRFNNDNASDWIICISLLSAFVALSLRFLK